MEGQPAHPLLPIHVFRATLSWCAAVVAPLAVNPRELQTDCFFIRRKALGAELVLRLLAIADLTPQVSQVGGMLKT
jgi:hypothetical protein